MTLRSWIPAASASQVVAFAGGALTNLLYARMMPLSSVGKLAILTAVASFIVLLADGGLQLLSAREIASGKASRQAAAARLLWTIPVLVVVITGLVALAGAFVGRVSIGGAGNAALLLELAAAVALFQIALTLTLGSAEFRRRARLIAVNGILTACFTAAALAFRPSVAMAVHATVAAYAIIALLELKRDRTAVTNPPPLPVLRAALREARPLWANSGVTFVTASADVLLAGLLFPLAVVGQYQIFKKLAVVALSPLTTLLPPLFAHLSALTARERIRTLVRLQRFAAALVGVTLALVGPLLHPLVRATAGSAYDNRSYLFVVLIGIGALQFTHNFLGYALTAAGRFWRPLAINSVVAVSGLGGALAGGAMFGLKGFVGGLALANASGVVVGALLMNDRGGEPFFRGLAASVAAFVLPALFTLATLGKAPAITAPLSMVIALAVATTLLVSRSTVLRVRPR